MPGPMAEPVLTRCQSFDGVSLVAFGAHDFTKNAPFPMNFVNLRMIPCAEPFAFHDGRRNLNAWVIPH